MSQSEMTSRFDRDVARIWALNQENRGNEALDLALSLVERYPDDPRSHFEYAGVLDFQGREADAVAPYRRAQALGLAGDDLPRLYVQLGSTLRNVGDLDEAVRFLAEGRQRFPDHAAIRAFHALALVSAGRCPEAAVTLLELVTEQPTAIDLDGYDRALRQYTDESRIGSSAMFAPRSDDVLKG
jgi:Flp pilus assembly protein TadD